MKVGQDLQDDSGLKEAHFVQLVSSCFVARVGLALETAVRRGT
jgi:hypothetical protein